MKPRRRILSPTLMLYYIALGVTPASAFYNPNSGRWLNRDPSAEAGGANIGAFVANDPIRLIDGNGLAAEPSMPDCAPCTALPWEHKNQEGKSGDVWGSADVNEIVSPGPDRYKSCCACGKSGSMFSTRTPVCTAKIYIAAGKQPGDPVPNQNTVGHSDSIWHHETLHINHAVESIRNRDALYKALGAICVPDRCSNHRAVTLARFSGYYETVKTAKDAGINCKDASADCQLAWSEKDAMARELAEAVAALNDLTACMISECGFLNLGLNLCGAGGTCR